MRSLNFAKAVPFILLSVFVFMAVTVQTKPWRLLGQSVPIVSCYDGWTYVDLPVCSIGGVVMANGTAGGQSMYNPTGKYVCGNFDTPNCCLGATVVNNTSYAYMGCYGSELCYTSNGTPVTLGNGAEGSGLCMSSDEAFCQKADRCAVNGVPITSQSTGAAGSVDGKPVCGNFDNPDCCYGDIMRAPPGTAYIGCENSSNYMCYTQDGKTPIVQGGEENGVCMTTAEARCKNLPVCTIKGQTMDGMPANSRNYGQSCGTPDAYPCCVGTEATAMVVENTNTKPTWDCQYSSNYGCYTSFNQLVGYGIEGQGICKTECETLPACRMTDDTSPNSFSVNIGESCKIANTKCCMMSATVMTETMSMLTCNNGFCNMTNGRCMDLTRCGNGMVDPGEDCDGGENCTQCVRSGAECSDGIDNDGDNKVDAADSGCHATCPNGTPCNLMNQPYLPNNEERDMCEKSGVEANCCGCEYSEDMLQNAFSGQSQTAADPSLSRLTAGLLLANENGDPTWGEWCTHAETMNIGVPQKDNCPVGYYCTAYNNSCSDDAKAKGACWRDSAFTDYSFRCKAFVSAGQVCRTACDCSAAWSGDKCTPEEKQVKCISIDGGTGHCCTPAQPCITNGQVCPHVPPTWFTPPGGGGGGITQGTDDGGDDGDTGTAADTGSGGDDGGCKGCGSASSRIASQISLPGSSSRSASSSQPSLSGSSVSNSARTSVASQASDSVRSPGPDGVRHLECVEDACMFVNGGGLNTCDLVLGCSEDVHAVCVNNSCMQAPGPGANECSSSIECGTHTACQDNACVSVIGEGENECANVRDCIASSSSFSSGMSSSVLSSVSIDSSSFSSATTQFSSPPFTPSSSSISFSPSSSSSHTDRSVSTSLSSSLSAGLPPDSSSSSSSSFSQSTPIVVIVPSSSSSSSASQTLIPIDPLLCGNGILNAGETCDDGNKTAGDGCDMSCQREDGGRIPIDPLLCGNAILNFGETCDDGNLQIGDGCSPSCMFELILISLSSSRSSQTLVAAASLCGNGVLETPEECDDSNRRSGDGCNEACLLEIGICGDGKVQQLLGEQCEQSLHDSSLPYGCRNCRFFSTSCGDGKLDSGEECDKGPLNSTSPNADCRPDCSLSRCGDSVLDSTELCDDGNRRAGDGCDSYCRKETTLVASDQTEESKNQIPNTNNLVTNNSFTVPFPYTQPPTPYALPFASLQPLIQQTPQTAQSGPAAVAVIGAGAAAGLSWVRRRRK